MQAKNYTLPTRLGLCAYASFTEQETDSTAGGDRYALLQCSEMYAVALNEIIFLVTLSHDAARLVYDTALGRGGKQLQRIQI